MELIKPELGLIFWMVLSFTIVFLILRKAAWKPILTALKDREISIENAMNAAEKAKLEMEQLQKENEKIIAKARDERDKLIKEARDAKDKYLEEAKIKADEEALKIIKSARESIKNEKEAALEDIKIQVSNLSIEIAEKILKEKLSSEVSQNELIESYLKDFKMN